MADYKVLKSGQLGPYQDSVFIVEVYLEKGLTKEQASDQIEDMKIGYSTKLPDHPFNPRLLYLNEKTPGVWEFKTTSMYTG